ncbi:hypothetical protein ACFFJY_02590 [Fictibacillus aquaticus]|uniref:Uncharacterized protein n=1 Tax=Fictibacillus aquaticus TaxID=2021314 RepID=A0A235F8B3_9BACL|nr:hypothetical protein [Fictibacillus aquaticus]OYD57591.1 hypothetical protein CGZ90_13060 [Fictibacillus aquaticus]
MNTQELKQWIIEKGLVEESIKAFWESFYDWEKESPEEYQKTFPDGFSPKKMAVYIHRVSLTFTRFPDVEDHYYIIIAVRFEYEDDELGEYEIWFDPITGEVFDDWWILF